MRSIAERTLGKDHAVVATYLLGLSLQHQNRKDYERALPELQRAIAIAEKTSLPGDHSITIPVHNLGNIYSK